MQDTTRISDYDQIISRAGLGILFPHFALASPLRQLPAAHLPIRQTQSM